MMSLFLSLCGELFILRLRFKEAIKVLKMAKQLELRRNLIIGLLPMLLFSCSSVNNNQRSYLVDSTDKSFFEVLLTSEERTLCSPDEMPSNWIGIVINAPLNIDNNQFVFPICGFYRLSLASINDSDPLKILVRHIETDMQYTGFLIDIDDNPEEPFPLSEGLEGDVGNYENMTLASYFNPNILDYVDMPLIVGRYQVVIEYGNEKSNQVLVSIDN
jgi:hypothetical protein